MKPRYTCCMCGLDHGINMIMYDRFGKQYCYDCWEKLKAEKRARRKERATEGDGIPAMYRRGMKPSEIARAKGCTVEHVYEVLNRAKK